MDSVGWGASKIFSPIENVDSTSKNILNTLEKFQEVKDKGFELQGETKSLQQVRDISYEATKSVRTVASSMIETINELSKEADSISS